MSGRFPLGRFEGPEPVERESKPREVSRTCSYSHGTCVDHGGNVPGAQRISTGSGSRRCRTAGRVEDPGWAAATVAIVGANVSGPTTTEGGLLVST